MRDQSTSQDVRIVALIPSKYRNIGFVGTSKGESGDKHTKSIHAQTDTRILELKHSTDQEAR